MAGEAAHRSVEYLDVGALADGSSDSVSKPVRRVEESLRVLRKARDLAKGLIL